MEFRNLWKDAKIIFTGSDDFQAERIAPGVPAEDRTERADKGNEGTVGREPAKIAPGAQAVLDGCSSGVGRGPELRDDHAPCASPR